jgi:hypothetical protein
MSTSNNSKTNLEASLARGGDRNRELWKEIAEFAKSHNSNELLSAKDLPRWVLDIPTPSGLVLAADAPQASLVLVGDVQALALVNLEKEGLEQYRDYVQQRQQLR